MKKLIIAGLALGLTLAAVTSASAGQTHRVPTDVRIYGAAPADGPGPPPRAARRLSAIYRFYGQVFAGRAKCTKLRKINLYEKRDGRDFKLGSGFTDTLGRWSVNADSGQFEGATFYAKAPKAKRGNVICKADRSPNLTLT